MTIAAVMPTYGRYDLRFERGEGAWLYDMAGRRYLDFGAGVAVTALGHCHPHMVAALVEQAGKVWHTSNLYNVPGQERLAARLVANSFADTVFFCNSGAEANEAAVKMARRFFQYPASGEKSNRFQVISALNAFHGRTLATLAAGGQDKHRVGFAPQVEGFIHVPFGDLEAVAQAISPLTAAIMVEPIQGEGGILTADPAYLQGLRALADDAGILLIFDEVQTGMGRTGKLFAHEWSGVTPDIMSLAKGLGGGFPIGACLATERAASALTAGSHGSTFGGGPLATASANAVLDVILDPRFLQQVNRVADYFHDKLNALARRNASVIAEVRGRGLMIGLKTTVANTDFVKALIERGLLTVPAGDNVVRLLPPLIITTAEADAALAILEEASTALSPAATAA